MAESASTPAQPSARPTSPQIELNDLVIQACDDANSLYGVMHAYTALEKLVDASASTDSEEPSGPELSALLSLLNEKLMARIEAINATAAAVRAAPARRRAPRALTQRQRQHPGSRPARLPHLNHRYRRHPHAPVGPGHGVGLPVDVAQRMREQVARRVQWRPGLQQPGAAHGHVGRCGRRSARRRNLDRAERLRQPHRLLREPLAMSRPALSRNLTSVSTISVTGTSPSALCHTARNS
jgi:hypothetical protein